MNLVDFLDTKTSFGTFSESKPFSEADDIPDGEMEEGNDEQVEEEVQDDTQDDTQDIDNADTGEDEYVDDQGESNETPEVDPEEDVADVNESNISLNSKLSESFVALYTNQSEEIEKIISSNLESSEFGAEFKILIEEYQTTLEILYDYKTRLFETESTAGRMERLIEFKSIFNNLTIQLNVLMDSLNDSDDDK